jgi:SEC-C motif
MENDNKQLAGSGNDDRQRYDDDGKRDDRHDRDDDRKHERPGEPPGRIIHPKPTHGGSAVRARLAKSADAMKVLPEFSYQEYPTTIGPMGVWTGKVQPIQLSEDLCLLLDDLAHDRPVFCVGSELRHLKDCIVEHCGHGSVLEPAKLQQRFEIAVSWTGDEALPRAFVASPLIPDAKRMHMWRDGAICAFLASERVWVWHRDTVVDFIPHVLVWLVKWMVYDQTGAWIGSQHGNTPQYHLDQVHPKAPCWCGGGREYRKCHRGDDLIAAGLAPPRWLRHQQRSS